MPNVPMNISKVLAEQSANTQLTENAKLDPTAISKLNYEVMYKMLEVEVEKLILENTGKCYGVLRRSPTYYQILQNTGKYHKVRQND